MSLLAIGFEAATRHGRMYSSLGRASAISFYLRTSGAVQGQGLSFRKHHGNCPDLYIHLYSLPCAQAVASTVNDAGAQ